MILSDEEEGYNLRLRKWLIFHLYMCVLCSVFFKKKNHLDILLNPNVCWHFVFKFGWLAFGQKFCFQWVLWNRCFYSGCDFGVVDSLVVVVDGTTFSSLGSPSNPRPTFPLYLHIPCPSSLCHSNPDFAFSVYSTTVSRTQQFHWFLFTVLRFHLLSL